MRYFASHHWNSMKNVMFTTKFWLPIFGTITYCISHSDALGSLRKFTVRFLQSSYNSKLLRIFLGFFRVPCVF